MLKKAHPRIWQRYVLVKYKLYHHVDLDELDHMQILGFVLRCRALCAREAHSYALIWRHSSVLPAVADIVGPFSRKMVV